MTTSLTKRERERTARQISITALILAALAWGPAFIGLPNLYTASLMGYLPSDHLAFWWLPVGTLCTFAAIGWIFRSKEFAILALLIPFAGFGIFLLRFGVGMGSFR